MTFFFSDALKVEERFEIHFREGNEHWWLFQLLLKNLLLRLPLTLVQGELDRRLRSAKPITGRLWGRLITSNFFPSADEIQKQREREREISQRVTKTGNWVAKKQSAHSSNALDDLCMQFSPWFWLSIFLYLHVTLLTLHSAVQVFRVEMIQTSNTSPSTKLDLMYRQSWKALVLSIYCTVVSE